MKIVLKTVGMLYIVLMASSFAVAAGLFDYKMAGIKEFPTIESYYQPLPENTPLQKSKGGRVHNVILLIGDGMGQNHVTLTRQQALGMDKKLHMERLPVVGQVRTFSANKRITDSAASGTAMACGIKTNNGMIGMDPEEVTYYSVLELLSEKGYRTGLVSTSAITHATPASFASHVKARGMQTDIASHLLDNQVDVMFGGGRKFFLPKGTEKGTRKDKRDLLEEAGQMGYRVADTRQELRDFNQLPAIALFADEGMTTFDPEPSVAEMSQKAIELLSQKTSKSVFASKPNFFLMIEGSQIDWAAHANDTDRVIRQTLLFDLAVHEAIEFAKRDKNTLVIVTADHETGGLILKDKENAVEAEWSSNTHTASDVPVYAFGPGSEQFSGVLDNTDIAKRIAELTGLKEFPILRTQSEITEEVSTK